MENEILKNEEQPITLEEFAKMKNIDFGTASDEEIDECIRDFAKILDDRASMSIEEIVSGSMPYFEEGIQNFIQNTYESLTNEEQQDSSPAPTVDNADSHVPSTEKIKEIQERVTEKTDLLHQKAHSFKDRIDIAKKVDDIDKEIGSLLNELYKEDNGAYTAVITDKEILPHLSLNVIIKIHVDEIKAAISESAEGAKASISEKASGVVSQIRESIGGAIKDARERLDEVRNAAHELLNNVMYDAKFRLDSGKERAVDILTSTFQKAEGISEKSHNNINSIKDSFDNMITRLNEKFKETGKVAGEIIQDCREDIKKFGRFAFEADLVEATRGIISRFAETTRGYTDTVIGAFKAGAEAKLAAIAAFGDKVGIKVSETGDKFEQFKETTGEKITSLKDKLETEFLIRVVKGEVALHNVEAACEKKFSNLIDSVHDGLKALKADVDNHISATMKKFEEIGEKIKSGAIKAGDMIDKTGAYIQDVRQYNQELDKLKGELADKEKLIKTFEKALSGTSDISGRTKLHEMIQSFENEIDEINEKIRAVDEQKEQAKDAFLHGEYASKEEKPVAERKPSFFQRLTEKVRAVAHTVSEKISAVLHPHKEPVGNSNINVLNPESQAVNNVQNSNIKDEIANPANLAMEESTVSVVEYSNRTSKSETETVIKGIAEGIVWSENPNYEYTSDVKAQGVTIYKTERSDSEAMTQRQSEVVNKVVNGELEEPGFGSNIEDANFTKDVTAHGRDTINKFQGR